MPYEFINLKDDPRELEKLNRLMEECRQRENHMESVNIYYRNHGTCHGYPNMPDEIALELDKRIGRETVQDTPYSRHAIRDVSVEGTHLLKRTNKILIKIMEEPVWKF